LAHRGGVPGRASVLGWAARDHDSSARSSPRCGLPPASRAVAAGPQGRTAQHRHGADVRDHAGVRAAVGHAAWQAVTLAGAHTLQTLLVVGLLRRYLPGLGETRVPTRRGCWPATSPASRAAWSPARSR
jgi:hypothetical protein